MRSLTYSFDDVSLRFISTLTGISDYNGEGLGTISIKSLTAPTKLLGSADGQTMTLRQPGSRTEVVITTPQVSSLATKLLNNYELLSKASSAVWNSNQIWLRHKTTKMEVVLTFVSYKNPPDLVFTSRGQVMEFTFVAEAMNVVCLTL